MRYISLIQKTFSSFGSGALFAYRYFEKGYQEKSARDNGYDQYAVPDTK